MKQCYAWPDLPTYTEAWKACKTQIVVCVLLSLLVMITAAVLMHNKPLIGDEPGYDAVARSLIAGKGYWYPDYWLSSKAPGYSTFLAGEASSGSEQ